MKSGQQIQFRFIVPGILLYGLLVVICWTTAWCSLPIPLGYEEIPKLFISGLLAFPYSALGLREMVNKCYYSKVNANLSDLLKRPFLNNYPELNDLHWDQIEPIFYRFIDNDNSLRIQSRTIRWNGFLWTSTADIRAICVLGLTFVVLASICGQFVESLSFDLSNATCALVGLIMVCVLTFPFSHLLTEKHCRLGEKQCNYIVVHYKDELLEKLLNVRDQSLD